MGLCAVGPHFLDPIARHFFVDWEAACHATVALLRAEAGREPHDRALRELIGELSTLSPEFRKQWAAHDVRIRHDGVKRLRHPDAGDLELTYHSLDLPLSNRAMHDLTIYTAEPGTRFKEQLRILASWTVPQPQEPTERTRHTG
nr:DNA-binding protein [Streptomyces antimycoticus]